MINTEYTDHTEKRRLSEFADELQNQIADVLFLIKKSPDLTPREKRLRRIRLGVYCRLCEMRADCLKALSVCSVSSVVNQNYE